MWSAALNTTIIVCKEYGDLMHLNSYIWIPISCLDAHLLVMTCAFVPWNANPLMPIEPSLQLPPLRRGMCVGPGSFVATSVLIMYGFTADRCNNGRSWCWVSLRRTSRQCISNFLFDNALIWNMFSNCDSKRIFCKQLDAQRAPRYVVHQIIIFIMLYKL